MSKGTYLDRVKGPTGGFWMELNAPNFLSRLDRGLYTLDGRVVTIDEEWLPSSRERVGKCECVLMVLTAGHRAQIIYQPCKYWCTHLVTYTRPALIDPDEARARTG